MSVEAPRWRLRAQTHEATRIPARAGLWPINRANIHLSAWRRTRGEVKEKDAAAGEGFPVFFPKNVSLAEDVSGAAFLRGLPFNGGMYSQLDIGSSYKDVICGTCYCRKGKQ